MSSITQVKVRATIDISNITIKTPYILSFSVNKNRGQISTCNARVKVDHDSVVTTGTTIKVSAGTYNDEKLIYTGIIKSIAMSPCFDDPKYVILDINSQDVLSKLEGKSYARRCRATKSSFMIIKDVVKKGFKNGKFLYDNKSEFFGISPDGLGGAEGITLAPPPTTISSAEKAPTIDQKAFACTVHVIPVDSSVA